MSEYKSQMEDYFPERVGKPHNGRAMIIDTSIPSDTQVSSDLLNNDDDFSQVYEGTKEIKVKRYRLRK